ncbi:MAG: substrate-binding periplasmic protein [Kordiimonas sp.]
MNWQKPLNTYVMTALTTMGIIAPFPPSALSAGLLSGQDPGETIEIIAAHLEGRLDDDPQSGYNKLLKKILPTQSHYLKYQRYPLTRALRKFAEAKRVCLFPASKTAVASIVKIETDNLYESIPIDSVSSHFISAPDKRKVERPSDLDGLKVGVQHGVSGRAFSDINPNITVITAPDDLTALKMVYANRVDVMYGWYPDSYYIAEKNNLPLPYFNPEFVIFETTTHFVCKEFGGFEDLLKILNTRIRNLKKTGELKNILGKHAQITPLP